MMSTRSCKTAGFTLLEVMVAVAILAIALVAILKSSAQSLDVLGASQRGTTATLLAASKLAEVEAAGVEQWNDYQGDFGDEYADFSWEIDTEPISVEGLYRVVVTVKSREEATVVELEEVVPGS
ncbi:MAG: prepilin-type N-terminal cleavage/methylation domain-containing protein [Deltaproteobacteria bacterium]|nr:prepilin-type N-terminal cleavage/methylation domain-containing protein [Deltaproteobacteria bacterium]MBW2073038.1 prepilin-type N-terminal cleavage/methylation domain-containing protein [Deltaproteobacteria bacterium]